MIITDTAQCWLADTLMLSSRNSEEDEGDGDSCEQSGPHPTTKTEERLSVLPATGNLSSRLLSIQEDFIWRHAIGIVPRIPLK